jgi:thymidylate synthase (FAD)
MSNERFEIVKGSYDILTPKEVLKASLRIIELAGRTCYKSVDSSDPEKFCLMLLSRGHLSVFEHSLLTVRFKCVSRGFTHELVRHRLNAFSQESTRYVDYTRKGSKKLKEAKMKFILPPGLDLETVYAALEIISNNYYSLRERGFPPEDSRQFLPIGLGSEIVVSGNFRQWRHMFKMRTSPRAHWEIRGLFKALLTEVAVLLPCVFGDQFLQRWCDDNKILCNQDQTTLDIISNKLFCFDKETIASLINIIAFQKSNYFPD